MIADETGVHFISVAPVEHFRFPVCGQITEEMREVNLEPHTLEDFARVLDTIFEEIAIGVILQDSKDAIAVRVAALGIQGHGCMRQVSKCQASSSSQQRRSDGNAPSRILGTDSLQHEVPANDPSQSRMCSFIREDALQFGMTLSLEDVDHPIHMMPHDSVPSTCACVC